MQNVVKIDEDWRRRFEFREFVSVGHWQSIEAKLTYKNKLVITIETHAEVCFKFVTHHDSGGMRNQTGTFWSVHDALDENQS